MITLHDVTNTEPTVFGDLILGDYFIWPQEDAIWKKLNKTTAIQITNNSAFLMTRVYDYDVQVTKIEITSIDYRRIK